MRVLPASLVLLGALASSASIAAGQGATVSLDVSALVGDPVAVNVQQALAFGTVLPGVPKVVDPVAGGAAGTTPATVTINGRHNAEIVVTFVLGTGTTLRAGANAMPIDGWSGCWSIRNGTAGCTTFVPSSSGSTMRFRPPGGGPARLWVYLGATVRPTPSQPAGAYSGLLAVTAAYTGL